MKPLRRYWFKFENLTQSGELNIGCGVSAYDYEDAINLLGQRIFGANIPPIVQCIEDVVLSTLETSHVHPNLALVNMRGIWFPQGYGADI